MRRIHGARLAMAYSLAATVRKSSAQRGSRYRPSEGLRKVLGASASSSACSLPRVQVCHLKGDGRRKTRQLGEGGGSLQRTRARGAASIKYVPAGTCADPVLGTWSCSATHGCPSSLAVRCLDERTSSAQRWHVNTLISCVMLGAPETQSSVRSTRAGRDRTDRVTDRCPLNHWLQSAPWEVIGKSNGA